MSSGGVLASVVNHKHSRRICQTTQHRDTVYDILTDTTTRIANHGRVQLGTEDISGTTRGSRHVISSSH